MCVYIYIWHKGGTFYNFYCFPSTNTQRSHHHEPSPRSIALLQSAKETARCTCVHIHTCTHGHAHTSGHEEKEQKGGVSIQKRKIQSEFNHLGLSGTA